MKNRTLTDNDKLTMVKAILTDLATKDVKETLLQEKCTGKPINPTQCPVARYVLKKSGVKISIGMMVGMISGSDSPSGYYACATPREVKEFIHKFDDGEFPELWD